MQGWPADVVPLENDTLLKTYSFLYPSTMLSSAFIAAPLASPEVVSAEQPITPLFPIWPPTTTRRATVALRLSTGPDPPGRVPPVAHLLRNHLLGLLLAVGLRGGGHLLQLRKLLRVPGALRGVLGALGLVGKGGLLGGGMGAAVAAAVAAGVVEAVLFHGAVLVDGGEGGAFFGAGEGEGESGEEGDKG